MKKLFILALTLNSFAFAGVKAFLGPASETVYLEAAPKLGKDVVLMKITGLESKWANKVFKTQLTHVTDSERYSFEYDLELSSGVQKRSYGIMAEVGKDLVKGSSVQVMELSYPEAPKALRIHYDAALTKSSQKMDLQSEFKKNPFKPEVD